MLISSSYFDSSSSNCVQAGEPCVVTRISSLPSRMKDSLRRSAVRRPFDSVGLDPFPGVVDLALRDSEGDSASPFLLASSSPTFSHSSVLAADAAPGMRAAWWTG